MQDPNDEVLIGRLVRAFGGVPGVSAIVLGGSRARGEASAQSDYDIGLYYEPTEPIESTNSVDQTPLTRCAYLRALRVAS